MYQTSAVLKKGQGRTLKSGGLWIYDNEIDRVEGSFDDGELINVLDFDGYFLGYGFINSRSTIRIRMMSRRKDHPVTREFLRERVRRAWEYRKNVMGFGTAAADTDCCRVIFGEADFLPGLVVDKFSDVLVVESLALGIDRLKETILEELTDILAQDGIRIRGIYERSDAKVRLQEGLERFKGYIGSPFDPRVEITENGVHYIVNVEDGQKTGFFLDQKYNRRAAARLCPGKKVLDCFTHTGSFALNAGLAGAASVLGVDASSLAVDQAKENAALNHLEDRVRFECHDVFELLPDLASRGELYDVVILDPPAFAKNRNAIKNAVKGYREINTRGLRLVRDGGYLVTCTCSHFMDPDLFSKTILEAARGAHKRLRQVEFRTQACDHPILWADDPSYYLKLYIFQVVEEM